MSLQSLLQGHMINPKYNEKKRDEATSYLNAMLKVI
jgi:hypothetical protein